MGEIIHLVKTKINIDGDLIPQRNIDCPKFKDKKEKSICKRDNEFCCGIFGENIIKDLGNMNYLLECKYYCR